MFRYVDYIYNVYKEKSFSRAAEKLHISQSSLSTTVRKAEREIGSPIFNRDTMPISLTEFGQKYIQASQALYLLKNDLDRYISEMKTTVKGRVAIGASSFFSTYLLADAISEFRKEYPEVKIELFENVTPYLQKRLDSGFIDLMITNTKMDRSRYRNLRLFDDHLYVMVLPALCPELVSLDRQADFQKIGTEEENHLPAISLATFGQTPFLLLREGNNLRRCTDGLFREAGIKPPIVLEMDQTNTLYSMARLGMGAAVVGSFLIRKMGTPSDALFFRLDSRIAERGTYANILRSRIQSPALERFLDSLQQQCRDREI
ncbi:LysR family transcriptional regulator [Acidaminococcus sp. LBK-2]|uniref:LysR family transcriptional regulator n=1 Tax=Acidaminococcus sp. LBK-2 TaxID=3456956 RepID=UPI003FA4A23F